MHPVKNDLPENSRNKLVPLLQSCLVDGIDLMLQAKQAHWNVKGENFSSLHELFDHVYQQIEEGVDLLAERIVQLGGIAKGTCSMVIKNSTLPSYPLTVLDGRDHAECLSSSLAAYAKVIRKGIAHANEWEDAGSADILTQISRTADKSLWMVESHVSNGIEKPQTLGLV